MIIYVFYVDSYEALCLIGIVAAWGQFIQHMCDGPGANMFQQKPRLPHSPELAMMSAQQNKLGPSGPSLCFKNLSFCPAMGGKASKNCRVEFFSSALCLCAPCLAEHQMRGVFGIPLVLLKLVWYIF